MNVVIGRYFDGNTFFHKQDPRLKIVLTFIFVFLLFIANHLITVLFFLLFSVISFLITTRSIRYLLRICSLPIFIFFALLIFNFLTVKDYSFLEENHLSEQIKRFSDNRVFYWDRNFQKWEEIKGIFYDFSTKTWTKNNILWYSLGPFRLTPFSLVRAFSASIRILCMMLLTKVLTYSTKPVLFTKAIEDLLFPLSFIGIPVSIFAMVMSITYRFIPTLLDEANRIMKAQTSRGVDFKSGNFNEKAKALSSLIIPLFVSSLNKAWELSESMESRLYDPRMKRTRYRQLKFAKSDWASLFFLLFITTITLLIQWYAIGIPYWYAITYQRY